MSLGANMQNPDKPQFQLPRQLAASVKHRDYEREYLHAKLKPNKLVLLKKFHTLNQSMILLMIKNHPDK